MISKRDVISDYLKIYDSIVRFYFDGYMSSDRYAFLYKLNEGVFYLFVLNNADKVHHHLVKVDFIS